MKIFLKILLVLFIILAVIITIVQFVGNREIEALIENSKLHYQTPPVIQPKIG